MTVRSALQAILGLVDYTTGKCRPNEMVGAVIPVENIDYARKELANDPEPGYCNRHGCHFKLNEAFNNNCPACYWEHEAAEEAALREKITPKR